MYNLKVPTTVTPDVLLRDIGADQHLFFVYGAFQHLPSVTFRIIQTTKLAETRTKVHLAEQQNKEAGKVKINAFIAELNNKMPIANIGRLANPQTGTGDGEVEDIFEVTLKMPKGTDLAAVEKFIVEKGGAVQDKRTPEFYYVQFVSTQKLLTVVRDFVLQKHDYIKDVFEFPNKK